MDFCGEGIKEERFTQANNRTKLFSAGDFTLVNRSCVFSVHVLKNLKIIDSLN